MSENQDVQEVDEGPIEGDDPIEVVQKPSVVLEDIPGPEPLKEVSEVEVAEPEFEQAEIKLNHGIITT